MLGGGGSCKHCSMVYQQTLNFHLTSLSAAWLTSGSCKKEAAAGSSGCECKQDGGSAVELDSHDTTSRKLTGSSTDSASFVP